MMIFGRKPSRYLSGLFHLPRFLQACWRTYRIFEGPGQIVSCYIRRRSPRSRVVRLRSGHVIYLSDDSADILTVFLVFAREDYGKVAPGSAVVDIGANIGVFSLFAACSGAKTVLAYEPSDESFALLRRNIEANGFDEIIQADRRAVVGEVRGPVKFPRRSSVHNAVLADDVRDGVDFDFVPATTLSQIVGGLTEVNLLKLDCEGAEYDILLKARRIDVRKAAEIRLEYHTGPRDTLIGKLRADGFRPRQCVDEGGESGYLWLIREPQV